MRESSWPIVFALALALAACGEASGAPSSEPVEPTRQPVQGPVEPELGDIRLSAGGQDFLITPLARYRVAARVLSRERYWLGWAGKLSPIDLALGWGYMADPSVDRFIDWGQGGRWYSFHWSANSPFASEQIALDSANTHVVPGSSNLRRALLAVRRGDTILLSGYLIDARPAASDEARWHSSLTRSDRGNGSCELMLVNRLVNHGIDYR